MKTEKLSTLFTVAVISMLLLIAGMSVAVRGDDNSRSPELAQMGDDMGKEDSMPGMDQLIGHEEALSITFESYNGTLVSLELEKDDDNYAYEIEIMVDGMEHQIEIDASTGEVLEEEEGEADEDFDPDLEQLIGHEEALDIAFKRVNGTLVAFELYGDEDDYTYEIEIVEKQSEYEFEIDAYTGEVLESEVDDDGRHRRERGVGRSWNGTQGNFTSFDLLEDGISNYTLHTNNTNLLLFE
ncbi:MAG: PepSY domain-containing protein, partial [Candidatus Thermoplasmatota archaeon]